MTRQTRWVFSETAYRARPSVPTAALSRFCLYATDIPGLRWRTKAGAVKSFWVAALSVARDGTATAALTAGRRAPPPESSPLWKADAQQKHLGEKSAEYCALSAEVAMRPGKDEPSVENYWQRPDGRKVFLVRFLWGQVRIEKRLHLLSVGGTPVYEMTAGLRIANWHGIRTGKRRRSRCGSMATNMRLSARIGFTAAFCSIRGLYL